MKIALLFFSIVFFTACKKSNNDLIETIPEQTWTLKQNLPIDKSEGISFSLNDKGYIFGGTKYNVFKKDLWQYDPTTNTWAEKASLSVTGKERRAASSFTINGKGYIFAGKDSDENLLNDMWEYNPNTDSWTQKASLPFENRYSMTEFAVNGKGYVFGGISNGVFKKDLWEYNPETDSWTQKASLPDGMERGGAIGLVLNGKAYIATGSHGANTFFDDLWEYDPTNGSDGTWTEKAFITGNPNKDRRYGATGFVVNNKIYVLGGKTNIPNLPNILLDELWEYNANNNAWIKKSVVFENNTVRSFSHAFTINNKVYLFNVAKYVNDSQNVIFENSFWQFLPE